MTSSSENELRDFIASLPYSYKVTAKAEEVKGDYKKFEGKKVSIAGRALAVRKAGKLVFIDILDQSGKIQAYFDYAVLGEELFTKAKSFNAGDILGVEGTVFKTNPGEISIKVSSYEQLSKAIQMLPNKWQGLQDVETRYRKRYIDLIMNPEARKIFLTRAKVISLIREYLDNMGFLEVETPFVQPVYGGADAQPFITHVNTLNEDQYLRISLELYLKRLIIGGFERVYEIGKAFRNEDLDTTHSPEYTILEWYRSYADYNDTMTMLEELLEFIVKSLFNATSITYQGKKIDFKAPFKKIKFVDTLKEKTGKVVTDLNDEELFELAESNGIKFLKGKRNRVHAYDKLFDVLVQDSLIQPTFVMDHPRETTPLARPKRGNPKLVERFEIFINGKELGNCYSELNNPIIQKENFKEQEKRRKQGDTEAPPQDLDFVDAMEYGMPPNSGFGMGVDRLIMLLTDKASIKEVILFPMEKREKK